MKLLFILIPLFSFIDLYSPVSNQTKDDNLIQNTNIKFDSVDFEKLEIKIPASASVPLVTARVRRKKMNRKNYVNIL